MASAIKRIFICKSFGQILLLALLLLNIRLANSQGQYIILSPKPNTIVTNGNLFVAVQLSSNITFLTDDIKIYIDNTLLPVSLKVQGGRLSFVYENSLPDGKHTLQIQAKFSNEPAVLNIIEWDFYINVKEEAGAGETYGKPIHQWSVSGNIMADNRSQFLDGSGQNLRQEPAYTRTLSVNLIGRYKNAQLPIKFYGTTENITAMQNRNFFQVGFVNKWLDITYGDINPSMDRFVLTGVRLRGIKAIIKDGGSSLHFYYGILNDKVEGDTFRYIPGSGIIPQNFINDSTYMLPGTYERWMMAGRLELGDDKDIVKFGIHAFKAKDDMASIRWGFAPKDNFAAGSDFSLKLFKRRLVFGAGAAISAFTNDISYGIITKQQIDTTFNTNISFDPAKYSSFLIMNSSTVPIIPKGFHYGAYFGSVAFTNRFQSFSFEYRKNGPQYISLGNPFMRNNYEGIVVNERVNFWKRRVSLSGSYQNFANDLNQTLISRIRTDIINGTVYLAYSSKFPSLMVSYITQGRKSEKAVISIADVKDRLNILSVNTNYNLKKGIITHNFRLMFNNTGRTDDIRPQSQTTFTNIMLGYGETIGERWSFSVDGGQTYVRDYSDKLISDIGTYTGTVNWQIVKQKLSSSLSISNNMTAATIYSNQSQRLSIITRLGYKFYKGMGLDAEYGYQPFTDNGNPANNYSDQYVYLRYTYDFDIK